MFEVRPFFSGWMPSFRLEQFDCVTGLYEIVIGKSLSNICVPCSRNIFTLPSAKNISMMKKWIRISRSMKKHQNYGPESFMSFDNLSQSNDYDRSMFERKVNQI
jgi:hypothetical protein